MNERAALSSDRIVQMASAFYESATLFAALEAGVFTYLQQTPGATAPEVSASCQLSPRGIRLLLDACTALGLLDQTDGRYTNTPATIATLVPGAPHDLTRAIRYNHDVYAAWGHLPEFVRTGHPVEAPALHLGADPERTRRFVLAMHGRALGIGRAVVPLLDLAGCRTLLDLAGGPGTYAVLMAQANPDLHCTVLDLPPIVQVAGELIGQAGMSARVETIAGDYHTADFPGNRDASPSLGRSTRNPPRPYRTF